MIKDTGGTNVGSDRAVFIFRGRPVASVSAKYNSGERTIEVSVSPIARPNTPGGTTPTHIKEFKPKGLENRVEVSTPSLFKFEGEAKKTFQEKADALVKVSDQQIFEAERWLNQLETGSLEAEQGLEFELFDSHSDVNKQKASHLILASGLSKMPPGQARVELRKNEAFYASVIKVLLSKNPKLVIDVGIAYRALYYGVERLKSEIGRLDEEKLFEHLFPEKDRCNPEKLVDLVHAICKACDANSSVAKQFLQGDIWSIHPEEDAPHRKPGYERIYRLAQEKEKGGSTSLPGYDQLDTVISKLLKDPEMCMQLTSAFQRRLCGNEKDSFNSALRCQAMGVYREKQQFRSFLARSITSIDVCLALAERVRSLSLADGEAFKKIYRDSNPKAEELINILFDEQIKSTSSLEYAFKKLQMTEAEIAEYLGRAADAVLRLESKSEHKNIEHNGKIPSDAFSILLGKRPNFPSDNESTYPVHPPVGGSTNVLLGKILDALDTHLAAKGHEETPLSAKIGEYCKQGPNRADLIKLFEEGLFKLEHVDLLESALAARLPRRIFLENRLKPKLREISGPEYFERRFNVAKTCPASLFADAFARSSAVKEFLRSSNAIDHVYSKREEIWASPAFERFATKCWKFKHEPQNSDFVSSLIIELNQFTPYDWKLLQSLLPKEEGLINALYFQDDITRLDLHLLYKLPEGGGKTGPLLYRLIRDEIDASFVPGFDGAQAELMIDLMLIEAERLALTKEREKLRELLEERERLQDKPKQGLDERLQDNPKQGLDEIRESMEAFRKELKGLGKQAAAENLPHKQQDNPKQGLDERLQDNPKQGLDEVRESMEAFRKKVEELPKQAAAENLSHKQAAAPAASRNEFKTSQLKHKQFIMLLAIAGLAGISAVASALLIWQLVKNSKQDDDQLASQDESAAANEPTQPNP